MVKAENRYINLENNENSQSPDAKSGLSFDEISDENLRNFLEGVDKALGHGDLFTVKQLETIPGLEKIYNIELTTRKYAMISHVVKYKGQRSKQILHRRNQVHILASLKYVSELFPRKTITGQPIIRRLYDMLGPHPIAEQILPPSQTRQPVIEYLNANPNNDQSPQAYDKIQNPNVKAERQTSITYLRNLKKEIIGLAKNFDSERIGELVKSIDPDLNLISTQTIDLRIAQLVLAIDLFMNVKTQQRNPEIEFRDMTNHQLAESLSTINDLFTEFSQFKNLGQIASRLQRRLLPPEEMTT